MTITIRPVANTIYEKQRAVMCNLTIITINKLFSGLTGNCIKLHVVS